ncbi:MAG: molybdopterin-dependent oxidoreductase, partial [Cytophagaceae bacterium]|nr:molybdopterin-dependent oxidoreductase [Cytophagaceae bacterium]
MKFTSPETATHYRTCNLCEAMCGLEIKYVGQEILSIAGDKADPFSRGHICPKAVALKDIYHDPNRLKRPIRRTGETWQEISWEEAFDEVVDKLSGIKAKYGPDAIGIYAGNPSVHNSGTALTFPGFAKAIGTRNFFSATSVDQLPHHFASWQLFGHPLLLPIPDIDHTDFWLILGGNPIASNGSIMTAPDVANRLKAIQQRGGKVVVVDPRRTETALRADEHLFIRPGTDVYFLLALLHVIFVENLVRPGRLADFTDGIDEIRAIVAAFSPEIVAEVTGIPADAIRRLAIDFAQTERAVAYGRVGVSTQAFGGACLWLISVLNSLTGHLDEPGGAMFTTPALDILANAKPYTRYDRHRSRVSGRPEFMGELPVSCLAEEVLTPGENQIRALITNCGNPVLSTPNGRQLDEALAGLDFMVCFDIYLNETTRHAHLILPPATGLETAHYDTTFHLLAIRNTAKYSEPLYEKADGAKYDWEIFEELRMRLEAVEKSNVEEIPKPQDPEAKLDTGLRFGPYGKTGLTLQALKDNPQGIDFGPLQSRLPGRLTTPNQRINLAPDLLTKDLPRIKKA